MVKKFFSEYNLIKFIPDFSIFPSAKYDRARTFVPFSMYLMRVQSYVKYFYLVVGGHRQEAPKLKGIHCLLSCGWTISHVS